MNEWTHEPTIKQINEWMTITKLFTEKIRLVYFQI